MKMDDKRTLTPCACDACRKAKTKCNGKRPACTRCLERGLPCTFATGEGQTRQQALKDTNTDQVERLLKYERVVGILLHGQNAESLLRELRVKAATAPDYIAMQALLDDLPVLSPTHSQTIWSPEPSPDAFYPRSRNEGYNFQPQYRVHPQQQQQADEKRPVDTHLYQSRPCTYPSYSAPHACAMDFGPLQVPSYQFGFDGGISTAAINPAGTIEHVSLSEIESHCGFLTSDPLVPYSDYPPACPDYYAPS